jgi:hypothetical protein
MKTPSLFFLLWLVIPAVKGQSVNAISATNPGGVPGAIQWYCTDTAIATPGLRNQLSGPDHWLSVPNARTTSLNFHPALIINGNQQLRVHLGARNLNSVSYFTVYQSLDTAAENSIWHITNAQQTTLILTTDRMADLPAYQYMNYKAVVRSQPKVNVYVHHKEKDTTAITDQYWNIGIKPAAPNLPIVNFKGLIPEIIAYDKVLNSRERLQVASYLALKYGITLTEPAATYVNSAGNNIWDGYDYPEWHNNIAGICRDDTAGLHQAKATSSHFPGLLTISTQDALNNISFLLWGDNGKPLTTAPKIPGLPSILQKTWLIKPYGNPQLFITDLEIDTKAIDATVPVQPVYWLIIDRSGTGTFSLPTTEFIKMSNLSNAGKATFSPIKWDPDGSGKDVWGIIAAQDLLLATTIDQPACTYPNTGSLQIRILGGQAPFQLTLNNTTATFISKRFETADLPVAISALPTGKYFLKVTDAAKRIYKDSLYINNSDIPAATTIADSYTLSGGKPLQLDAATHMPDGLSWQWKGPGDFQATSARVTITEPGLYKLSCSKNGCVNEQDVLIKAAPANILCDVTVYPNPSAGAFNARITMDKPAPVTLSVYTQDGKLVYTQKGHNRANYLFTGELKASGTYELIFTSGLSKTNKRLVIAK